MFTMCKAALTHVEIQRPREPLNWTMTAWASWATSTTTQNRIYQFFRKRFLTATPVFLRIFF